MSKDWKVENSVGIDNFWNCTQHSPTTPNGCIFVSWNVPPLTLDKFHWIKEIDTKNHGGTHNRSCKVVPFTLDDLFNSCLKG